jgi:AI-2 transport protein TqsA
VRVDGSVKTVLGVAATIVIVAGLRESGGFLLPLLTALFIAVVSTPVMGGLAKLRAPRWLQIVLTVLLDVAVLAGVIALVASSLSGFNEAIPRYQSAIQNLVRETVSFLNEHGIPVRAEQLESLGDAAWVIDFVTDLFRELTTLVSNALLVIVLVVFMLFEISPALEKLRVLLGGPHADLEQFADAATQLKRYLVVKTYLSLITGALSGICLAIVGVDFPLLWGLLIFLLNYIPTIGAAIAVIPPVLVALLTLGPGGAIGALVSCLIVSFVIGNFFEPRLMGEALGLSTLVVVSSMIFWGWVWGPIGAIFAVPVTMLLRSAFAVSEDTRWLAVLLSSSAWVDKKRREWGWTTVEERSSGGTLMTPGMLEAAVKASKPAKRPTHGERVFEAEKEELESEIAGGTPDTSIKKRRSPDAAE